MRPTTLDLDAVEIKSESPAASPETASDEAASQAEVSGMQATPAAESGETPQEAPPHGPHPDEAHGRDGASAAPEVQPEPKLDIFEEPAREGIDAVDLETPHGAQGGVEEDMATAAPPEVAPAPKLEAFHTPPPRSNMPVVVAALAGGVVGAAVVLAALSFGLVPLGRSGDDLSPRLAAAEQDIASNKAAIDQAASRAAAAEDAAKAARDASDNALNMASDARKAAADLPANAQPAAQSAEAGGLTDRLAKAEADIAGLHGALDEAAKAEAAALGPVKDQAAAAASAAAQVQNDLGALHKQVAALAASGSAASNKAAAYAVALAEVAQAVRDGRPFGTELKTAASLGGHADALAPLSALAGTGVPSTETLAQSFEALRPRIVAAMTPKPAPLPADAGVMDRLMSSLGHVVVVTREGDGSPDDPAAPAQKVADALHRGDLAGAVAAFKTMPEAGQQAGAAWLAQASSALGALDVIKAETDAALQKLSSQ